MDVEEEKVTASHVPDGGWGWVVVIASLAISAVHLGTTVVSWVVLYADLVEAYDSTTAAVGIVNTGFILMFCITGFVAAPFAESLGFVRLHVVGCLLGALGLVVSAFSSTIVVFSVFNGFVAGTGFGLSNIARIICIQQYFDKNRTLANGLMILGAGVSNLIFSGLVRVLSNAYGWRGAVLLNGGLFLQTLPLSAVFRPLPGSDHHQRPTDATMTKQKQSPDPEEKKLAKNDSKDRCKDIRRSCVSYFKPLTNIKLDLFILGTIVANLGVATFGSHITNRAIQSGIDRTEASLLMSIMGGVTIVGQIGFSIVTNSAPNVNTVLMYALTAVALGLVTALMFFCDGFAGFAVGAAVGGVFLGGFVALQVTALRDTVGLEDFATSLGIFLLLAGTLTCLQSPLPGWVYDTTGDYNLAFLIMGVATIVGSCIMLPLVCWPAKKKAAYMEYDQVQIKTEESVTGV